MAMKTIKLGPFEVRQENDRWSIYKDGQRVYVGWFSAAGLSFDSSEEAVDYVMRWAFEEFRTLFTKYRRDGKLPEGERRRFCALGKLVMSTSAAKRLRRTV